MPKNVWTYKSRRMGTKKKKKVSKSKAAEAVKTAGEYYVEEIRDHGLHPSGQIQYLLKWEDYGEEENSWEFETHVTDCQELLQRFHSETVNGRHPPKLSWEELDAFTRYLKQVVSHGFDDLAVLYRLSDHKHTVAELRANQKLVINLKTEIEVKVCDFFVQKFDRKTNLERHRAMQVVKDVAKRLKLEANGFATLTEWFEFIDRRPEVADRLARFALTCNKVIAKKHEGLEISVSNDYDLEVPELEQYVGECVYDRKLYPKLTATDAEKYTIHSCECRDCFDERDDCCTAVIGFPMVYDRKGVLRKGTESTNPVIFECNANCECGADCPNRVIQRGRQYRLEIYRPPDAGVRGWAVRTLDAIPRGAFVSNYSGEVVSLIEANTRSTTYLFDLSVTIDTRDNEYTYVIDADKCGNVSRFINHSCEPNCRGLYSYVHSYNKQLPTVSLFTTRAIKPYEELTYDYGNQLIDMYDFTGTDDSQSVSSASDSYRTATIDVTEEVDSNGNSNVVANGVSNGVSNGAVNGETSGISNGVANGGGESRPAADRPERLALTRIECHCGSKYCRQYLYS